MECGGASGDLNGRGRFERWARPAGALGLAYTTGVAASLLWSYTLNPIWHMWYAQSVGRGLTRCLLSTPLAQLAPSIRYCGLFLPELALMACAGLLIGWFFPNRWARLMFAFCAGGISAGWVLGTTLARYAFSSWHTSWYLPGWRGRQLLGPAVAWYGLLMLVAFGTARARRLWQGERNSPGSVRPLATEAGGAARSSRTEGAAALGQGHNKRALAVKASAWCVRGAARRAAVRGAVMAGLGCVYLITGGSWLAGAQRDCSSLILGSLGWTVHAEGRAGLWVEGRFHEFIPDCAYLDFLLLLLPWIPHASRGPGRNVLRVVTTVGAVFVLNQIRIVVAFYLYHIGWSWFAAHDLPDMLVFWPSIAVAAIWRTWRDGAETVA